MERKHVAQRYDHR